MLSVCFISSIKNVSVGDWNRIAHTGFPFIRHEFLSALEQSGAVCSENGWTPRHLLVYEESRLIAVMPGYLKQHSYGEFVFDFAWAEAYQRSGLHYYPKYINAIPFSPITGTRLAVENGYDKNTVVNAVSQAIKIFVRDNNISSWHILFPEKFEADLFVDAGLVERKAVHFQWLNRSYKNFDEFLSAFNSRKRKNLRKERACITENDISFEWIEGKNISDELWEDFYRFYQLTYLKRSGHTGYLNKDFFKFLGKKMPENLLMIIARKDQLAIAGALNFKDSSSLYGRYWGCYAEFDFLHFETCYYQGIEYCIKNNLQRFDPGVQGEHKIQRGFAPVYTYSTHWIANRNFREAITNFLLKEEPYVAKYKQHAESLLPFKMAKAN